MRPMMLSILENHRTILPWREPCVLFKEVLCQCVILWVTRARVGGRWVRIWSDAIIFNNGPRGHRLLKQSVLEAFSRERTRHSSAENGPFGRRVSRRARPRTPSQGHETASSLNRGKRAPWEKMAKQEVWVERQLWKTFLLDVIIHRNLLNHHD